MNIKQKIVTVSIIVAFSTLWVPTAALADCGGAKTAIINCTQTNSGPDAKDNAIWGVLLIVLNIMTAGVGIAAVGGIVYASILYTSAQEDASKVKEAKDLIRNVVIGIVAYGLMYMGLNFLIPGGVFT